MHPIVARTGECGVRWSISCQWRSARFCKFILSNRLKASRKICGQLSHCWHCTSPQVPHFLPESCGDEVGASFFERTLQECNARCHDKSNANVGRSRGWKLFLLFSCPGCCCVENHVEGRSAGKQSRRDSASLPRASGSFSSSREMFQKLPAV